MKIKLILTAAVLAVISVPAAAEDSPWGEVSIGRLKEEGEKAVVSAAAKLKKSIPAELSGEVADFVFIGKPTFDISASEDGAFDRANVGIDLLGTRNFGIWIVNAGVEGSRNFDSYAGLIEIGWVYDKVPDDTPWHVVRNTLQSAAPILALQGGYKFAESTNDVSTRESEQDESEEREDEALARVKIELGLSTSEMHMRAAKLENSAFKAMLKGLNNSCLSVNPSVRGKVWFDVANGDFYHQETAGVEIWSEKFADTKLGKMIFKKGKIELSQNWGSGAPLFNRGEYFSAALKMDL